MSTIKCCWNWTDWTVARGDKTGQIRWTWPFFPYYSAGRTKSLGLHHPPCFLWAFAGTNINFFFFCIFRLKMCNIHLHNWPTLTFNARRTKILCPHPQLCQPHPVLFFCKLLRDEFKHDMNSRLHPYNHVTHIELWYS